MMGVGLVMSYSRGAWIGAAIGLLYLAKAYGKFKWRWVLLFSASVLLRCGGDSFLEHAADCAVVFPAAGFEPRLRATPAGGLERRL